MEKTTQKIEDKIKNLKQQIIANSKDAAWAKESLAMLSLLQKQNDIEAVELIVPVKEVRQSIDFGAYSLKKTPRGILFNAKGGLYTFVEMRMKAVYEMLDQVFYMHDNPTEDEGINQLYESYTSAVANVMQAPIFSSLGEKELFELAATMLRQLNDSMAENYEKAQLHEETEEDIANNNVFARVNKAIDNLIQTPLPPEDSE